MGTALGVVSIVVMAVSGVTAPPVVKVSLEDAIAAAARSHGGRLAPLKSAAQAPRSTWSRVVGLEPGTEIVLSRRGELPAPRIFVMGDAAGVTVLDLTDPALPRDVVRVLRFLGSKRPLQFAAGTRERYIDRDVQVGPAGVFMGKRKIADLAQVVRRIARDEIVQVRGRRTRPRLTDGLLAVAAGATAGFFVGGKVGAGIENEWHPCHCDDPGLKGFLIGAPVGAVAGGLAGYLVTGRLAPDIIYQAD